MSEAAAYLGVSEPTVREWIKRGALRPVRGTKPVLIERTSVREVHRALGELRERGQDREWLRAFVDYVHDRTTVRSSEVQQGLADIDAGRFEPA